MSFPTALLMPVPPDKSHVVPSASLKSADVSEADPAIVLDLIAQAELKIRDLELWRNGIHSDASLLLARIRQERIDHALKIEALDQEVRALTARSLEAERVAGLALAERENALTLGAMANARAIDAELKAESSERRAIIAEEWLVKLHIVMVEEFHEGAR